MRFHAPILAFALIAALFAPQAGHAGRSRADLATALRASAERRLAVGTHEQRQRAFDELLDACRLAPERTDIGLELGQLYLDGSLYHSARDIAMRVVAADSGNADGWLLLARTWKAEWIRHADEEARDHAIVCGARCAHLAPARSAGWKFLAPLLADAEEFEPGHDVAVFAARAAPHDPEAQTLLAAAAQRLGDLATAQRLFETAIPRLSAATRERYEDVGPLLTPLSIDGYQKLGPGERKRFVARFWADNDPDPVASQNCARLEYWTRVTQSLALYGGTARPGEWDMRAQYYVRYGRPEFEELNPITRSERLAWDTEWLVWGYPSLGLRIWMGASSTTFGYPELIASHPLTAFPSQDSLGRHGELTAINHGWSLFHKLPPGVTMVDTRVAASRFLTETGTSVFAQVEAAGGLSDQYTARWVVLDTASTAVAREEEHSMGTSACEPERGRAASFTTPLPPGAYSVAVEVSDENDHLGTARRSVFVPLAAAQLALSDLVITCSPGTRSVGEGASVRLEPQTGLFPESGDHLSAYFEIYHLAPAPGGEARFAYDCEVRSAARDKRGWMSRMLSPHDVPEPIHVSREETTVGPIRRQFLSVPVATLPEGRYQIEVKVRDQTSGAEASTMAWFERRK